MPARSRALLTTLAARYIWWKPPAEALLQPDRVIAQVMDIGTLEDILRLRRTLRDEVLACVLLLAEPGWFRPRSWSYWHHLLGLIADDELPPPLPNREH